MTTDRDGIRGTGWHAYVRALEASAVPIVIADPHAADMPLVFVNSAFLALTGYGEHEVLGRNCRFLQGPKTAEADRHSIAQGLVNRVAISLEILNYKKDGSAFWNELHMAPMYDEAGGLEFFVASQIDITERKVRQQALQQALDQHTEALRLQAEETRHLAHEMTHRVRNSLSLVQSMLRLQASSLQEQSAREAIVSAMGRIEAVIEIQRTIESADDAPDARIADTLGALCAKLTQISPVPVQSQLEDVSVTRAMMMPMALIVSELVTNAQKHGFPDGRTGEITVGLAPVAGGAIQLSVQDNGVGIPKKSELDAAQGFGMKMLRGQIRQLGGALRVESGAMGSLFCVTIPVEAGTGKVPAP
ncbi:PAS domain-containing protein [Devosia rhodophyticola]|uniref:histidine kinase n=1 Tax=Devosia rhodophyticola TaxID=3026423 RepID=A0ABY7Z198_9HYPH|nr:PAS domain-containing protein [Devosia rhodophyticola]WDR07327.1 PAS domain-containing protein [Devosia rhodophyticola]